MTVVPSYGRDYKSKAEVLADWNANKDFQCCDIMSGNGQINKAGAEANGIMTINVRYKKLANVAVIKRSKDGQWK